MKAFFRRIGAFMYKLWSFVRPGRLLRFGLYLATITAVASAALAYVAVRPALITSDITPADLGLAYEETQFETVDGVKLHGWFIPAQTEEAVFKAEEQQTIVALHGYPADKGNLLPALASLNTDFNLFLFDFRYHGDSGGAYSGLGAKESKDLNAAVEYLGSEYDVGAVGVYGFSLGASVALMAAADTPAIRAVYAESGYANLHRLARETVDVPVFGPVMVEVASLMVRPLGINTRGTSPVEAVPRLDIPVHIVHSRHDEEIDVAHAREIYNALPAGQGELTIHDGRRHGELRDEDLEQVRNFFGRVLR